MESELRAEFLSASATVKPTIARLNFSHEAIARWLLENPDRNLGECAQAFGYTQGWLSIIIHSDAFQAKMTELQLQADRLVVADIPAKMRGVASLALEGLADQVDAAVRDHTAAPRNFLLQTADSLLAKLGYGGAKAGVTVRLPVGGAAQVTVVDAETLDRARTRLIERRGETARVLDGEATRVLDAAG